MELGPALNKSTFDGEPAYLCDAGISKIRGLSPLTLPQKFLSLFNRCFVLALMSVPSDFYRVAVKIIAEGLIFFLDFCIERRNYESNYCIFSALEPICLPQTS